MNKEKIIFHIDVNSAFLSWTAIDRLSKGENIDIREVPAIIGGDESNRHGVVLAKSTEAKKHGIVTGESIYAARKKCPNLIIIPPSFNVYKECSSKMMNMLREYTPFVEQYSIDECFLDVTGECFEDPIDMANRIKDRIKKELGFTVNIGISVNKLLAKMASEFRKPDKVNTLYKDEIESKMWPLKIRELFMVGKSAEAKLNNMCIYTIGDLANYDLELLIFKFKSYGKMIWQYANGIDNSVVATDEYDDLKCISNSTTLPLDISKSEDAYKVLLELSENVATRLRNINKYCMSISVSIKTYDFKNYSHQKKLKNPTYSTQKIFEISKLLFDEMWKKEPIRLLGVNLSQLSQENICQLSMFEEAKDDKTQLLDKALDDIRKKYGQKAVVRSICIENKNCNNR